MSVKNSIDLADPLAITGTRVLDAPRDLVWSGVDRPETSGAMVGAERISHHHKFP